MQEAIAKWDISRTPNKQVLEFYSAAPAMIPTTEPFSQNKRYDELDLDRNQGCIREIDHAYSLDGGLAVLKGNIALDGCIVKTAGVDENSLVFSGPASPSPNMFISKLKLRMCNYYNNLYNSKNLGAK